jgi:hypothetical protein
MPSLTHLCQGRSDEGIVEAGDQKLVKDAWWATIICKPSVCP